MWNLIDNRTLLLCAGLVTGAFALTMLLIRRTQPTYPGFGRWALGLACFTAAALPQALRGSINDFFPIIVGNGLACLGLVILCDGTQRFCNRRWRREWAYAGAVGCVAVLYWFRYVHPDERMRIVVFALFELAMTVQCGAPLLRGAPSGSRLSYRFCAMLCGAAAAALVFRLAAVAASHGPVMSLGPSAANTTYFLCVLFLAVGVSLGAFLLTWERLVGELHDANLQIALEAERFIRMEKRAAAAERLEAVGRLAGGIAHYFNNQMFVIIGHCGLLLDDPVTAPAWARVEAILKASRHSADLTDRLLAFSQAKMLKPRKLGLAAWIGEIAAEIRRELGEGIEVELPDERCEVTVLADNDGLRRVILALARNAREAMPNGGAFWLSLAGTEIEAGPAAEQLNLKPGRYACLTIRDTGTGMEEETLRHLFEPFFTTKGLAKSEGLSLAGAFGFLKQSKGAITVESSQGAGTTFHLFLPAGGA